MDNNGVVPQVNRLGKAVAMNAKKNGSLEGLSLKSWFNSFGNMSQFLEAMRISDYDHEMWYGDKKIAKEMTKEQLDVVFHCKIKYLNVEDSTISNNSFKLKDYQK